MADLVARCTCGGRRFAGRRLSRAREELLDIVCRWEGTKACPFCGKPFKNAYSLRDHLLSGHREQLRSIQSEALSEVLPKGEKRLHGQIVEVAVQCSKCGSVIARGMVNMRSWQGLVPLRRLLEELGVGETCPHCGAKLPKRPRKVSFMPSRAQAGAESGAPAASS